MSAIAPRTLSSSEERFARERASIRTRTTPPRADRPARRRRARRADRRGRGAPSLDEVVVDGEPVGHEGDGRAPAAAGEDQRQATAMTSTAPASTARSARHESSAGRAGIPPSQAIQACSVSAPGDRWARPRPRRTRGTPGPDEEDDESGSAARLLSCHARAPLVVRCGSGCGSTERDSGCRILHGRDSVSTSRRHREAAQRLYRTRTAPARESPSSRWSAGDPTGRGRRAGHRRRCTATSSTMRLRSSVTTAAREPGRRDRQNDQHHADQRDRRSRPSRRTRPTSGDRALEPVRRARRAASAIPNAASVASIPTQTRTTITTLERRHHRPPSANGAAMRRAAIATAVARSLLSPVWW